MPRGFCWFWWMTAPYWYPYAQRLWRLYPCPPWWTWGYGPTTLYAWPFMTREQEIQMLQASMKMLQDQLDWIKKRLEELKK